MVKKYSDSLKKFRKLIEKDYKRVKSKKRQEEKRDLLEWYVDKCPAKDGPELSSKFKDYGIELSNDYKKVKSQIIDELGLKKGDTYRYFLTVTEMENIIDIIENIYSKRHKSIIFFSKGKNGEIDSLYIRIRNSFAHGNYFKIKDYYCLWNETGSEGKPKKLGSFMILKYDDLKFIFKVLGK